MKKKSIVTIAMAAVMLAATSMPAFAAELPEDQPPAEIVVEQLTDDQLDGELGENINEIEALVGDDANDITNDIETELDIDIDEILGAAEEMLGETETAPESEPETPAIRNNPNQQLSKEAREQRLAAKLERLEKLMAERKARIAAKELRVAAADERQDERQAARDERVAAADTRQDERQAARDERVAAADTRQANRQTVAER